MNSEKILVVEDNNRLRKLVVTALGEEGYNVFEADSGKRAYGLLKQEYLDMVLLDIRLGDLSGIDILRTIRRQDENLPVIIISSINDRHVKVDGFDIGCDDYITKPFYIDEMLSRVKRLLKRSKKVNGSKTVITNRITSGPFELDFETFTVFKNRNPVPMRKKLFDLLYYFIDHQDIVLSNETIFTQVWEDGEDMNENSLYVHIRHLRKLIEDDPSKPKYIQTVRKLGYKYSVA
ncbi:MAG: response regulator transcription factor [Spirochaetia bacterium]